MKYLKKIVALLDMSSLMNFLSFNFNTVECDYLCHINTAKIGWFFCLLSLVFPSAGFGATYYVDAESGNDSHSGISQGNAWQTISRVKSASLAPGDTVLFKRGQTFSGDLDSSEDGASDAPITISSFGSGNPAVLSRVTIRGDYYIVENLTIDNNKAASDAIRVRDGKKRHIPSFRSQKWNQGWH